MQANKILELFPLLWIKPISQRCIGDILRKKTQFQFIANPTLKPMLVVDTVWRSDGIWLLFYSLILYVQSN